MDRRDLTKPGFGLLLGVPCLSFVVTVACSATSSTVDGPRARLDLRRPNEVTLSTSDSGTPADSKATLAAWFNPRDSAGSNDSGAPAVPAKLLQQAADVDLDPSFNRSYQLPVGDTLTTRKAMGTKYADLAPASCRAEVRRRHIPIIAVKSAAGIVDPMRLAGKLRGVHFVTPGPKSVHGILDCRLVVLLDDLSDVLASEGVATVYVDGLYRPKAHLPGKKALSQHALGLAIDIHSFGTKDGRALVIERDFAGAIGSPVCGATAAVESRSRDSVDLRNIVCAIARAKAFHYLLTPNYDQAHVNHIHGDIKRGAREHVVR
jgi:hypothetical protein